MTKQAITESLRLQVWNGGKDSSTAHSLEKITRKLPTYITEILLKMA